MQKPKPISGFYENLPEQQIIEDKFKKIIKRNYSLSGFTTLDTPAIERVETLVSKGADDNEIYGVFRLKGDRNEKISLGLRFDLTVPLARYIAQYEGELNFPFKRQQIAKSWRGERPQKGRYREFYQADIDIIGNGKLSLFADVDILIPIFNSLKELDFGDFIININNKKLLSGFLLSLNIENISEVIGVIDKKDKVKSIVPMLESLEIQEEQIKEILNLIKISKELSSEKILSFFKSFKNDLLKEGLYELEYIYNNLLKFGIDKDFIKVNPSISRGLNYYTGLVFETFIVGKENFGSIASGGRYENLCSNFTKNNYPGVGGSIGLSRLLSVLSIKTKKKTISEILVLNTDNKLLEENLKIVKYFRGKGISTEIYLDDKTKFAKQLKYANNKSIPYVIIFGEEEYKKGVLQLKILDSGEQIEIQLTQKEEILNIMRKK